MIVRIQRLGEHETHVISVVSVNGVAKCFVLEDRKQNVKVYGQTCIPAGIYPAELRTVGKIHTWLKSKFPFHKGSIWIKNIPGFEYVLLHPGNSSEDTLGCLLPGLNYSWSADYIGKSSLAYCIIAPLITDALINGENVFFHVVDVLKG